ncbi:MAG: glycosyl transferase group 1 [Firmicutes bacterium]|nr:glycosyl transferase group 1 [Bacillota bacterium]
MKIAHINFHDTQDGSSRTARTLLDALAAQGQEGWLFAHHKISGDERVISLPFLQTPWQKELLEAQNRQGLGNLYSASLLQVLQHPAFQAADVLHLHAIKGNYFSFLLFPFLTAIKPTVWTLYDSLAFTGGCYNADSCDLWRDMGCRGCPLDAGRHSSRPENARCGDSRRETLQRLKNSLYRLSSFTVVSPSRERQEQAVHSILEGHDVRLIYHGVDTEVFQPGEQALLRKNLSLPATAKIVLFAAPGGFANSSRGGQFLREALHKISKEIPGLLLITVGGSQESLPGDLPVKQLDVPFLTDARQLAAYYGAADVAAVPTIFNTPGMTPLEAMACATPVVAFDSGGMKEIITHRLTGYLARMRDSEDLAAGLALFLNDPGRSQIVGEAARQSVMDRFTARRMTDEYLALYKELLSGKKPVRPQPKLPAAQPLLSQDLSARRETRNPVNFAELEAKFQIPATVDKARTVSWKQVIQEFRTRYEGFEKQKTADRALFTDLYFDYCLRSIDSMTQSSLLWEFAGQWFAARRLPPRCGGLHPVQEAALLRICLTLRSKLHDYFSQTPVTALKQINDKQQWLLVSLWRQVFLNVFSALNLRLTIPAEEQDLAAKLLTSNDNNWYPRLLLTSLYAPFSADRIALDAGKLWSSKYIPVFCKAIIIFWMLNLPYFNAREEHRQKLLKYALDLCGEAVKQKRLMTPAFFNAFIEEAMTAFWRSTYVGGNNLEALNALGDFLVFNMHRLYPGVKETPKRRPGRADGKLRVGYVSRNFASQAVSYYMVNRILHHDREKFAVTVFALGERQDDMTELFRRNCDQFIQMKNLQDIQSIAQTIREQDLDILVYADLGMDPVTYMLAAFRLAPVQAVLVGHGITSGLPTIDYYVSGDHEPPDGDSHYREKLIRLPNLGAAQYPPLMPQQMPNRRDFNLPEEAVVFVSCANGIKHAPQRDRLLVQILQRAPQAWIVLKPYMNPPSIHHQLTDRLLTAARQAKVADRLIILPPLRQASDLMGLLALSDVQLDTYPYGGWTTNMEALFMGLPIITQEGDMARSRWGAYLLRALGVTEGIAASEQEYVDWAVTLAEDAMLRQRLHTHIKAHVRETLFNGSAAQPAYEEALLRMWNERIERGAL